MQCQRTCRKIWIDYEENNQEVIADVQGNHPNFTQNVAEKENFVMLSQKSVKASRCLANVVSKPQGSKI